MDNAPHSELQVHTSYLFLHLSGEVDVDYLPTLEKQMEAPLKKVFQLLIIDCQNLEFIDSKIVGYMAYLYTTLAKSKKNIVFLNVNETVNDILTLVGLTSIIPLFNSREEALTHFNLS